MAADDTRIDISAEIIGLDKVAKDSEGLTETVVANAEQMAKALANVGKAAEGVVSGEVKARAKLKQLKQESVVIDQKQLKVTNEQQKADQAVIKAHKEYWEHRRAEQIRQKGHESMGPRGGRMGGQWGATTAGVANLGVNALGSMMSNAGPIGEVRAAGGLIAGGLSMMGQAGWGAVVQNLTGIITDSMSTFQRVQEGAFRAVQSGAVTEDVTAMMLDDSRGGLRKKWWMTQSQIAATAAQVSRATGTADEERVNTVGAYDTAFGLGSQATGLMGAAARAGMKERDLRLLGGSIGIAAGVGLEKGRWGEEMMNVMRALERITTGKGDADTILRGQAYLSSMGVAYQGQGPARMAMSGMAESILAGGTGATDVARAMAGGWKPDGSGVSWFEAQLKADQGMGVVGEDVALQSLLTMGGYQDRYNAATTDKEKAEIAGLASKFSGKNFNIELVRTALERGKQGTAGDVRIDFGAAKRELETRRTALSQSAESRRTQERTEARQARWGQGAHSVTEAVENVFLEDLPEPVGGRTMDPRLSGFAEAMGGTEDTVNQNRGWNFRETLGRTQDAALANMSWMEKASKTSSSFLQSRSYDAEGNSLRAGQLQSHQAEDFKTYAPGEVIYWPRIMKGRVTVAQQLNRTQGWISITEAQTGLYWRFLHLKLPLELAVNDEVQFGTRIGQVADQELHLEAWTSKSAQQRWQEERDRKQRVGESDVGPAEGVMQPSEVLGGAGLSALFGTGGGQPGAVASRDFGAAGDFNSLAGVAQRNMEMMGQTVTININDNTNGAIAVDRSAEGDESDVYNPVPGANASTTP